MDFSTGVRELGMWEGLFLDEHKEVTRVPGGVVMTTSKVREGNPFLGVSSSYSGYAAAAMSSVFIVVPDDYFED